MRFSIYCMTVLLLIFSGFSRASDAILVLTPSGQEFVEIVDGLKGDLEEELVIRTMNINKTSKKEELVEYINKTNPKAIILVGNLSLNLYLDYQKSNISDKQIPSVAVGSLLLDKFIDGISNVTGIRYEIPFVSSAVSVRETLKGDLKRVGVIYRELMSDLIVDNIKYASAEGVELVGLSIPNSNENRVNNLKVALNELLKKDLDAIWVLNDNNLLNKETLNKVWVPAFKNSNLPVIVGLETLLSDKLNFGTFAVVPDHYGLGVQTASIVIDIMENNWTIGERSLEQPVSVKKLVSKTLLDRKKITVDSKKLVNFDKQL